MVGRKKGAASGFFGGCTGLLRALIASKCTRLCHCAEMRRQIVDMSARGVTCRPHVGTCTVNMVDAKQRLPGCGAAATV